MLCTKACVSETLLDRDRLHGIRPFSLASGHTQCLLRNLDTKVGKQCRLVLWPVETLITSQPLRAVAGRSPVEQDDRNHGTVELRWYIHAPLWTVLRSISPAMGWLWYLTAPQGKLEEVKQLCRTYDQDTIKALFLGLQPPDDS